MAYMNVVIKTDKHLQLLREPSSMSKIVFSAFVVGVLGVLIFGSETFIFKTLIAFSAMIISSFIVDNYEILDIYKQIGKAHLTRMHFCQFMVNRALASQPYTSCKLSDIQEVTIEGQDQGGKTKMHRVVLVLQSGIRLGVTEVFTNDLESEHEKIAETISTFIGIGNKEIPPKTEDNENIDNVNDNQVENVTDSSSSEDDNLLENGFEKITQAEIDKIEVKDEQKVTESGNTLPCDNADNEEEEKPSKQILSEVENQTSS